MTARPSFVVQRIAALAGMALGVACAPSSPPDEGEGGAPGTTSTPEQPAQATYHHAVRPLLEQACTHCHRKDAIAPFALTTFDEARAAGVLLRLRVEDGTMPPWGAVWGDTCAPPVAAGQPLVWRSDPGPDPGAAAVLAAWEEAGYPEGDPADAPDPQTPPEPLSADIDLFPGEPFTVAGTGDLHHCFVLDPGAGSSSLYVQGLEITPGLPRSVHSASVFVDAAAESTLLAGPGGDYPCFGDAGIDGLAPTAVWMAGDPPWRLPPGMAFAVPAGARVVLQVHYHPGGQPEAQDLTGLRLDLAETPPTHIVEPLRVGSPSPFETSGNGILSGPSDPPEGPVFNVPALAEGHTETVVRTIDSQDAAAGARIFGVAGHMHYSGTSVTVDVESGAGGPCLLRVPNHRLDWERAYRFDAPLSDLPVLSPGDRVRVRCAYDNTLDNTDLAGIVLASPAGAPVDLPWGRSPLTEVCAATLLLARPAP